MWKFIAMVVGIGLGAMTPGIKSMLSAASMGTVSRPIAIGLLGTAPRFTLSTKEQPRE
jgi:ACR3 family arsenite efflux pump ArsB